MGQRRILVVDDCIDTIDLLQAALEEKYEVFGIQEPARVFDAVELAEPDLVILDLMMPGISGFDILDALHQCAPSIRAIPFVILSCKRGVEDQKKAYAKGAKLYFSKPFEPERLIKLLDMFFQNAQIPLKPKQYRLKEVTRLLELRSHYHLSHLLVSSAVPKGFTRPSAPDSGHDDEEKEKKEPGPTHWIN